MIRVLAVDDHPALRAGLVTVLLKEPGIVPLPPVSTGAEALDELRDRPDVLLADYHLPDVDGISLCRQVKQQPDAPRVLLYSAHAQPSLALAALLAGVDGVLNKGVAADALFEAIRIVAGGGSVFPERSVEHIRAAVGELDVEDRPIVAMVADGARLDEVAEVVGLEPKQLDRRLDRIIDGLKPSVGTS